MTYESQRFLTLQEARRFLGLKRHTFDQLVRPMIPCIPTGKRRLVFDILDLNKWADHYKKTNGRPALRSDLWQERECQGLPLGVVSGTSTKKLTDDEFMKVLDRAVLKKQKNT